MNARQKGARGEREWRDQLRQEGYTARRGQQFAGGSDSPDVICDELARVVHFEVKRVQSLNIHAAVQQATRDGHGKAPVVAHRKNGQEWLITMPSWVFFALLRGGVEELHEMANEGWATPQSMGWVGSDGLP
jgi:Holliday junction resolvase